MSEGMMCGCQNFIFDGEVNFPARRLWNLSQLYLSMIRTLGRGCQRMLLSAGHENESNNYFFTANCVVLAPKKAISRRIAFPNRVVSSSRIFA